MKNDKSPIFSMFNFFKKEKKEPKDVKEVLEQFKILENNFNQLSLKFEDLKKEYQFSVQKVGLVRFNPFSEIGGDQSFSMALLDGNDNGLVLTSLYARGGNRAYGKPIKNGKSQYALSQEEIRAIELARKNNQSNKGDKINKNNGKQNQNNSSGS